MTTLKGYGASRSRPEGLAAASLGLLRYPSSLFLANIAAILFLLPVVTWLSGLVGATRVLRSIGHTDDEAFLGVVRSVRKSWRRDLPAAAGIPLAFGMVTANMLWLAGHPTSMSVVLLGAQLPILLALLAFAMNYIVLASEPDNDALTAGVMVKSAVRAALRRPGRSLLAIVVGVACVPVMVLPPLTIACGLTLPVWFINAVLTARRPAAPNATARRREVPPSSVPVPK
ncbi:hypothetical protein GU243_13570 [Pseudarthrobacter psychrotolerans]|uniref:DUF624 domain-containing protein n=1 Tax=Pseudarthrobacter psychrotolerans TaxID=2697569 RepID=A0A6P1NLW6_9MICC|nr:hypothetical protein [Pseudarthrobacter psychrotolerans]QHK20589.1 hypothetical protein GU243_13570 [Pseudarthrobacter psychrotolerans]